MAKGDFPSPPDQNRTGKKRVLKGFFYTLFICLVVLLSLSLGAAGVAAGYVAALVKDEPVRDKNYFDQKLSGWHQTSYAYFRDKSLIGSVRTLIGDRKLVENDEVSQYLIDALISTEDREFYNHSGIVPRSLLRAVYEDLTNQKVVTGGSTITQQLVKRAILENYSKTYDRKAKEILLALRLERMYSKEEILNAYLNSLYFGTGSGGQHLYGVQAAAQGIFGVDAKDLNIAQAAYLAGMIQRPNDFNPFKKEGLERGKKRMKMVLDNMLDNGKITQQQYEEARSFDIKGSLTKKKQNAYSRYPYIMMAVEERAAEALMRADGLDPKELSKKGQYQATLQKYIQKVQQGGYHIYTTIDKKLYDAMNKAAKNPNLYAQPITYRTKLGGKWVTLKNATEEVGATLIDVETGALLAFVGGRDFDKEQKNHALNSPRQPGSAMKPLLGYGPALDRGVITPNSIIIDEPLKARGSSKVYRNATGQYKGPVTAKTALQWSYNIPAIKVFRAVGLENGFSYLRKMNFPVHPYDGEASVIGGLTYGFTVERMTAGYAMIANGGQFNEPYMIEKIVDSSGKTVYEHKPDPVQVMSPQAAYMLTDMLKAVVRGGTAQYIGSGFGGYDLAGKTGTTQNEYDLWFVGYTPKVAMGVWVGYDYNHRISNSNRAKIVWRSIFQAVLKADPNLSPRHLRFKNPGGLPSQQKCFECGRQKEFEKQDKDKGKNNQQQQQPRPQPQPQPQPGPDNPGEGDDGNRQIPTPQPPNNNQSENTG